MKTVTILKVLNPALFIAVALQFTGIVTQQFIYADWLFEIHKLFGFLIFILIALHIVFNWTWIKNNFFKKKKKQ